MTAFSGWTSAVFLQSGISRDLDEMTHQGRTAASSLPDVLGPETGTGLFWFGSPGGSCGDRSGLSSLVRYGGLVRIGSWAWRSACLDSNGLGALQGLGRLLDEEVQYAPVEMSFDGSLFRFERQEHRSIE